MEKKRSGSKKQIWWLVLALVVIVVGGVLFVGAAAGWFSDKKVVLSSEYYCEGECGEVFMDVAPEEYEGLLAAKKSFVLFVDQGGCQTADKVRGFIEDYSKDKGVRVYRMAFSEMKNTSLYPTVRYYPSVVIVDGGKVRGYLRADAEEDSDAYNKKDAFYEWIGGYLGE